MRINIYNEEITDEVQWVEKYVKETNKTYFGVRIFLESSPKLHHTSEDDDRSAITFWYGTKFKAIKSLTLLISRLNNG